MNSPVVCSSFQSAWSLSLSLSSASTSSGRGAWSWPREGAASPRREEAVGATQAFSPSWNDKITDYTLCNSLHTVNLGAPAVLPGWEPVCVPVPAPAAGLLAVATHCHTAHYLASEPAEPDWGYIRIPEAEGGPAQLVSTLTHPCSPVGGQTNTLRMCSFNTTHTSPAHKTLTHRGSLSSLCPLH